MYEYFNLLMPSDPSLLDLKLYRARPETLSLAHTLAGWSFLWKWKLLSHVLLFATPYSPWSSPRQNTGVGSLSLLQGIFPTQESNPALQEDSLPTELSVKPWNLAIQNVDPWPAVLPALGNLVDKETHVSQVVEC